MEEQSAQWFWRRRFFKVFTSNGHGGHLGHVIWTKIKKYFPLSHCCLAAAHFIEIRPVVSEEKSFGNTEGR